MKEKGNKSKLRSIAKSTSVRVRAGAKERVSLLLQLANKKKLGRKIKFEDLFELAIGLVTDEHIKMLQEQSLTNEDKTEQLRQKYISKNGPITHDGWFGFMMTSEFQRFLAEQSAKPESDVSTIQPMTKIG